MPIPSSGIFRVYPSSAQVVNGTYSPGNIGAPGTAMTDAAITSYYAAGISDPANAPAVRRSEFDAVSGKWVPPAGVNEIQAFPAHTVIFDQTGTPTPIDFISASFPMGVVFSSIIVKVQGTFQSWQNNRQATLVTLKGRNSTIFSVVPSGVSVSSYESIATAISGVQQWGPTKLFGVTSGHQVTFANVAGGGGEVNGFVWRTDLFYIQGIYSTVSYSFTLNTPNANPGDNINITDSTASFGDFEKFKAYWKADINSTEYSGGIELPIVSLTASDLTLYLITNKGLPYGQRRIYIVGVLPGDRGEVGIAQVNNQLIDPTLVNGSGIYTLTPGKRNDTYYDRSVSPVITTDIKIP